MKKIKIIVTDEDGEVLDSTEIETDKAYIEVIPRDQSLSIYGEVLSLGQ